MIKDGELGTLKDIKGPLSMSGLGHVRSKEEALKAGICYKAAVKELLNLGLWKGQQSRRCAGCISASPKFEITHHSRS